MKKNVLRVLSLVLVASMLFAFASCKSTLNVHFVGADGEDLDMQALVDAINGLGGNGGSSSGSNDTPVVTPPPAQETPTQGTETPTQGSETTTAAPSGGETTTAAQQSSGMPATTAEVIKFYSEAANKIKNNAVAGYTKKEWQNVDQINIGADAVNSAVTSVLGNFMTVEADAAEQVNAKGSDDAKNRFPGWTLTDNSYVASATCTAAGSNYKIKIVMKDEDTPKKTGSVLGQVTNSLLYWEDIDATLSGDDTVKAILSSYSGIHVIYKNYTIEAEMTPDGKFIKLDHTADVDIIIGEAKILKIFTIKDKNGHMNNYCKYYDFKY